MATSPMWRITASWCWRGLAARAAAGQVGAGAEVAARTGDHDHAIVAVAGDLEERREQLVPHRTVGRVLLLRPVQRDR